jgi:hypothetical protein
MDLRASTRDSAFSCNLDLLTAGETTHVVVGDQLELETKVGEVLLDFRMNEVGGDQGARPRQCRLRERSVAWENEWRQVAKINVPSRNPD